MSVDCSLASAEGLQSPGKHTEFSDATANKNILSKIQ